MKSFFEFLSPYLEIVTAFSTLSIALFAIVTAFLTWRLASENRLLRKAGTEPRVVAYLKPDLGSYVPLVDLVLANVGNGPAQNVDYRIDGEEKQFRDYDTKFLPHDARYQFSFLPQGESIHMVLGGYELFGCDANGNKSAIPPFPAFEITVQYENMIGKAYDDTFSLDVSDFSNMGCAGRSSRACDRGNAEKDRRSFGEIAPTLIVLSLHSTYPVISGCRSCGRVRPVSLP